MGVETRLSAEVLSVINFCVFLSLLVVVVVVVCLFVCVVVVVDVVAVVVDVCVFLLWAAKLFGSKGGQCIFWAKQHLEKLLLFVVCCCCC